MNILVTGASKGLGYETAKVFCRWPGHHVFALSRDAWGLQRLVKACEASGAGSTLHILPFDLRNDDYQHSLLPAVLNAFDTVDILINNAGVMVHKAFQEFTVDDFDRLFDVNVKSVFRLIQLVLPYMHANSHIVNLGSMGGFQGSVKFGGMSLYSASKGAIAVMSECLAREFSERGIKVNCLALGAADTEMFRGAFPGIKAPLSTPEMAQFIADFAINGHRYFNGKVLPVAVSTP
jgi:NAD(P)-dependent dehydrogenase (short-subunit alcohol dehydrogenase family)